MDSRILHNISMRESVPDYHRNIFKGLHGLPEYTNLSSPNTFTSNPAWPPLNNVQTYPKMPNYQPTIFHDQCATNSISMLNTSGKDFSYSMQQYTDINSAPKRSICFADQSKDHTSEHTPSKKHFATSCHSLGVMIAPTKTALAKSHPRPIESRQQLVFEDSNEAQTEIKKEEEKMNLDKKYFQPETVLLTANVKCTFEWFVHTSALKRYQVLFEIFAMLQKVKEHNLYYELLLRDKSGPLLQVLYYKMEQPPLELQIGQIVRVVGRLLARTRLQAFSVRAAKTGELQRHDLYLSNQSLIAMKKNDEVE